jgi:hypothetical protein
MLIIGKYRAYKNRHIGGIHLYPCNMPPKNDTILSGNMYCVHFRHMLKWTKSLCVTSAGAFFNCRLQPFDLQFNNRAKVSQADFGS